MSSEHTELSGARIQTPTEGAVIPVRDPLANLLNTSVTKRHLFGLLASATGSAALSLTGIGRALAAVERSFPTMYTPSEGGFGSKINERRTIIARGEGELKDIKEQLPGHEDLTEEQKERLWWKSIVFPYFNGGSETELRIRVADFKKENGLTLITVETYGPRWKNIYGEPLTNPFEGGFVLEKDLAGGIITRWLQKGKAPVNEIVVNTVYQTPDGIHKGDKFGYELARTESQWHQLRKTLPLPNNVPGFVPGTTRLILLSPEASDERTHTSIAEIVRMSTRTEVHLKRETAQMGAQVLNKWVQIVDTPDLNEVHWIQPPTETFEIIKRDP